MTSALERSPRAFLARVVALALVLAPLTLALQGCGEEPSRPVSLLRIVAGPAAMEGQLVVLRGFLDADLHLYPSAGIAESFDRASSLQVVEPDPAGRLGTNCSGRSAELSGRLVRKRGASRASEDLGDYQLTEVERALALSPDGLHVLCWPQARVE